MPTVSLGPWPANLPISARKFALLFGHQRHHRLGTTNTETQTVEIVHGLVDRCTTIYQVACSWCVPMGLLRGCHARSSRVVMIAWSLCDTTQEEPKGSHKQIDPVFDGSSPLSPSPFPSGTTPSWVHDRPACCALSRGYH
jgi:hypothetical protein